MSDKTTRTDSQLYNEIATILYNRMARIEYFSNAECIKICMLLRLSSDNLACKTEIFALDSNNKQISFSIGNEINKLHDLAVELKNYFIDNNLTNGMPGWRYCWAEIDLVNNKVNFDFAYDENNREDKFKFSYE